MFYKYCTVMSHPDRTFCAICAAYNRRGTTAEARWRSVTVAADNPLWRPLQQHDRLNACEPKFGTVLTCDKGRGAQVHSMRSARARRAVDHKPPQSL